MPQVFLNIASIISIVEHGKLKQANINIFFFLELCELQSSMYILYMQPLITDILFELIHFFYIAPCIIIQVCTDDPSL